MEVQQRKAQHFEAIADRFMYASAEARGLADHWEAVGEAMSRQRAGTEYD